MALPERGEDSTAGGLSGTRLLVIMHGMDPFRDDRAALLARIAQLEQELALVRDAEKRRELTHDLAELARRVAVAATPEPPVATRLRVAGVFAALAALGATFGYASFRQERPAPFTSAGLSGADIPGYPHDVDPTALVGLARGKSRLGPTAALTSLRVSYARSNGLVDLTAATYHGSVAYSFAVPPPPAPPAASAAPLGAPPPPRELGRSAAVEIDATGAHAAPLALAWTEDGVPDPRCSVADVWRAAIAAGAPKDAVAVLEYGRGYDIHAGGGGIHEIASWKLEISGTSYRYEIDDATCDIVK